MPRQPNYYRILDIALSADEAEIRHAYRVLAKRYHPDRVSQERRKWAREQMARINAAREVLSDPTRRAAYDRQQGYTGAGSASAVGAQRTATQTPDAPKRRPGRRAARRIRRAQATTVRRERWRREMLSKRRLRVLGSVVTLGAFLVGALYWWRELAPVTSLPTMAWVFLGLIGLTLTLSALWKATE